MIPTLIKTLTASNSAALAFVDGASDVIFDSTYDEYMFVFTDIGPATNDSHFGFQVNATDDAGGGYDTSLITSTGFYVDHSEGDASNGPTFGGGNLAQSANNKTLMDSMGGGGDESGAGILHLFNPSSTTYVKHFYYRGTHMSLDGDNRYATDQFAAGYINDTTAIDEIQFKMSSGNFDGVIQLYGIA